MSFIRKNSYRLLIFSFSVFLFFLFACTYTMQVNAEEFDPNNYYGSPEATGGTQNTNQDTIDQYNALREGAVGTTYQAPDEQYRSVDTVSNDNTQETDDQYTSVNSVNSSAGNSNSDTKSSNVNSDAQTSNKNTSSGDTRLLKNPLKSQSIEEFILKIIDVLLVFALPIIVLYIMYAGYLFVTAQGDSGQISTARSALLWAVVGGVIVLGARVIVAVIQGTIQGFQ